MLHKLRGFRFRVTSRNLEFGKETVIGNMISIVRISLAFWMSTHLLLQKVLIYLFSYVFLWYFFGIFLLLDKISTHFKT